MNASSYTEVQRRAANQIWSAAGDYDFEPLFMALHGSQGDPDFYMNLIIGLAYRYYEKSLSLRCLISGTAMSDRICLTI